MARRRTPEEIARDFPPSNSPAGFRPPIVVDGKSKMQGTKGVTGCIKRQVRDALALGVSKNAHILIQLIAGQAIEIDGVKVSPDIKEVMKAFEIAFKASFEPLQPVVYEKMMEDLVDVLTDAKREDGSPLLTLSEVLSVKDALIAKWNTPEAA